MGNTSSTFFGFVIGIGTSYAVNNFLLIPSPSSDEQNEKQLKYVVSGTDHINFLSDMISRLWGNLRVALNAKIRESIEPLITDMKMPMKLEIMDMGPNPIRIENIVVHELVKDTDNKSNYFQFNLDLVWRGQCNIKFIHPSFGIANIHLKGRMQFVIKPLTNEIPCIGAIQYAFIDPPKIDMDFTGIAAIANSYVITDKIGNIVKTSLQSMMVLPNKMIYKMDPTSDYLESYIPPLGIGRVTVACGWGFVVEENKGLLQKDDIPDVYLKISLGDRTCKTKTIMNDCNPTWDETLDFLVSGRDQRVTIEAWDLDSGPLDPDDLLGSTVLTVGELLLSGGGSKYASVPLQFKNKDCGIHIALNCQLCSFSPLTKSVIEPPLTNTNNLGGLLTIIVIQANNLPISPIEKAASFVNVTYGGNNDSDKKKLVTGVVTHIPEYADFPGYDALNPIYDTAFQIPLDMNNTGEKDGKPVITYELVNGEKDVLGKIEIPVSELISSPNATISETRDIGKAGGASLKFYASISGFESCQEPDKQTIQKVVSPVTVIRKNKRRGTVTNIVKETVKKDDTVIVTEEESLSTAEKTEEVEEKKEVQITVMNGKGFKTKQKFLKTDIPDIYCQVKYGSNPQIWQTSTIKDSVKPEWDETKSFVFGNHNEVINLEAYDANRKGKDSLMGNFRVTVGQVLLASGGVKELELKLDGKMSGTYITIKCEQK